MNAINNIYRICRTDVSFDLNGEFSGHEPADLGLTAAEIVNYPWDRSGYRPAAGAYVAEDDCGFKALLCARESKIAANETRFGGAVFKDSCLEFFLNPCPSIDKRYVNIEINPLGVAHIGFGDGREGRIVLEQLPEGMNIKHSVHKGAWWAISYTIPFAFLHSLYGSDPEKEMLGNFYKCDESIHPHFGTWNPVIAAHPDFHRPECFGKLIRGK